MTSLPDAALAYADRGWSVFPVEPDGKRPLVRWGDEATTAPEAIRGWWERWPEANLAVACGPSGLVVVDVDAPGGNVSLRRLVTRGFRLPRTLSSITGGGGVHYWYRAPAWRVRNGAGRLPGVPFETPGVDLRAAGGYVVAPPSATESGYQWLRRWDDEPAPCPEWLREPERSSIRAAIGAAIGAVPSASVVSGDPGAYARAALREEVAAVRRAVVGTRNDTLNCGAFSLGQLVAAGLLDAEVVASHLLRAALDAGLSETEARATLRSGLRSGMAEPRRGISA